MFMSWSEIIIRALLHLWYRTNNNKEVVFDRTESRIICKLFINNLRTSLLLRPEDDGFGHNTKN